MTSGDKGDVSPSPPPSTNEPSNPQSSSSSPPSTLSPSLAKLSALADQETNPIRRHLIYNRLINQHERALLAARQEESKIVCADLIRLFAECATGKSFSIVWKCHDEHRRMHRCMKD